MNTTKASKYLSLILRHKPEEIGITLDKHGWANVNKLVNGMVKRFPDFTKNILEEIVNSDEKQRYSFNEDHTLIRANQGHSIPVDVELDILEPPEYLYHGTGTKYMSSIWREGLIPKSRLYVHLSSDKETAIDVGKRHGNPYVFRVKARLMRDQGFVFYKSKNGVWLTKNVPVEFLESVYLSDKLIF